MKHGIVWRLTWLYTLTSVLLLAAVALTLYFFITRTLENEDRRDMANELGALERRVVSAGNGWRQDAGLLERMNHAPPDRFFRLTDADGFSLVSTPFPASLAAVSFPAAEPAVQHDSPVYSEIQSDEEFYALAAKRLDSPSGVIAQVAVRVTEEQRQLAALRQALLLLLAAGGLCAALLGAAIARAGLRPLADITAQASAITPARLDIRLASSHWPAELRNLAHAFDAMLVRLQESFTRLDQFSANLAHELRTPVHAMATGAEIALGRERTPAQYRDTLGALLEECRRLQTLVDKLLFIARADQPGAVLEKSSVRLAGELHRAADFAGLLASERQIEISVSLADDLHLFADPLLLRQAVGNLLDNAVKHSPDGGRVELDARRADAGHVEIFVNDTGPGISAEALPHLFDRFYRADPARSAGGSGLGLAIVQAIMQLHDGEVRAENLTEGGARFILDFLDK